MDAFKTSIHQLHSNSLLSRPSYPTITIQTTSQTRFLARRFPNPKHILNSPRTPPSSSTRPSRRSSIAALHETFRIIPKLASLIRVVVAVMDSVGFGQYAKVND